MAAAISAVALLAAATSSGVGHSAAAPVAQSRVIKPAQVGQAKIGMTVAQAVATGEFNQDVANPPCDTIRLQPNRPWKHQYVVFVNDADRIAEIDVFGSRPRTVRGLGVGSTNAEVRQVYGSRLSAPRKVGFDQWGRFVQTGTGPARTWIGFLFGEALVDDGPLRARDTVTLVGVTKGERPPLVLDGC